MAFVKDRQIAQGARPTRSFAEQARRAQQAAQRGGGYEKIEGQYDAFWPNDEKGLWIALCPEQSWSYEMYDSEKAAVVKLEDQLFYAYLSHYVAASNRRFVCSAGPHRDKPCWGCAIRRDFYTKKRAVEEEKGVKLSGEAPINAILQYAVAGVELETLAKVDVLDSNGKPKKDKNGKPISREKPTSLLPLAEAKRLRQEGSTTFGRRMHYSLGKTHFAALEEFDLDFMNRCASCANELTAEKVACPECGETQSFTDEEDNVVTLQGESLAEARESNLSCACGYHGPMTPLVECSCGNPVEGKLLDFAFRIVKRKLAEKQSVLEIVEVKPIGHFIEKHTGVSEMLEKPLELSKIFAPSSLRQQEWMIPEKLRAGLSPAPRPKTGEEAAAVPYSFGDAVDDEEDVDEAVA